MGNSFLHKVRRRAESIGIAPVLLALIAVAGALAIRQLGFEMQLSLPVLLLLVAGVSTCWLLLVRRMQRAALAEARKFEMLVNAAPEAIIGVSDAGAIRFANSRVTALFGYTPAELIGASIELLIPERFRDAHVSSRNRYVDAPRSRPMGAGISLLARRKEGSEFPVEVSLNRIETGTGFVVLCIVRDVTEQADTRQALLEANRDLQNSLDELAKRTAQLQFLTAMAELMQCCVDEQELHSVVAQSVSRLLPQTDGAIYILNSSRNLAELRVTWNLPAEQLSSAFLLQDCWALRRGRAHSSSCEGQTPRCAHHRCDQECDSQCIPIIAQGETVGVLHVRTSAHHGLAAAGKGHVLQVLAEHSGLALANLRLREALRSQSIRDPLTGLYNRRFLDEWLQRELVRSTTDGCPLSALMLDLDHFKRFNDAFGHQSGDAALREVCGVLQRTVRGSDIVCRLGGEEIAVLLPDTGPEAAIKVAEKIRERIQTLVIRRGGEVLGVPTASIGVASFPADAASADDLFHAADVALYAAKREGRNRVVHAARSDLVESTRSRTLGSTAPRIADERARA